MEETLMTNATQDQTPKYDRLLLIAAAAEQFVAAMHVPDDRDRKLAEWRREQQAAYEALVEAVEQDAVTRETVHAADS
jgi:hypothetical protein